METSKIKKMIEKIPSMGGRQLGDDFDKYVCAMPNGLSIVEMGAWLGAGTAQIALAMYKHEKNLSTLYCCDLFFAHGKEADKAKNQGVNLESHQDTLPVIKDHLKELSKYVKIEFHKGNVSTYKHAGEKIGIFILDCTKKNPSFTNLITRMEKHFIKGQTIVFFMDYYYFKKTKDKGHECQKDYVERTKKYTLLKGQESKVHGEFFPSLSCAIMRFNG
jgi:hypothetical protein